jgi:uncharacterized membrane protein YbhN (UPF0104 family)
VTKSGLWLASKYLLAFGVLAFVLYVNWDPAEGNGLKGIWERYSQDGRGIAVRFLLTGVGLETLSMAMMLYRWYVLVRAQQLPFTRAQALRIGTLGFLFNAFLPGSVGGDVVKAAALARAQSRRHAAAVATVVMDRVMSLWGLVLLVAVVGGVGSLSGLLGEAAFARFQIVIVTCVIIVAVTCTLWFALRWWPAPPVDAGPHEPEGLHPDALPGGPLAQFGHAIRLYRTHTSSVLWAIVLCTLSNVCDILSFYCYVLAFWDGVDTNPLPTLAEHFLIVPAGLVISAIPLFPGGAGIGEAGFGGLYRLFHSAAANGIFGSLLFRVNSWLLGVLGYLLCLVFDLGADAANDEAQNDVPA